jgi:hypothetical protein
MIRVIGLGAVPNLLTFIGRKDFVDRFHEKSVAMLISRGRRSNVAYFGLGLFSLPGPNRLFLGDAQFRQLDLFRPMVDVPNNFRDDLINERIPLLNERRRCRRQLSKPQPNSAALSQLPPQR